MASVSESKKVELLEKAVFSNDKAEVEKIMDAYAPFEFTARALGIAIRFCDAGMVRLLLDGGCSFEYELTPQLKRKYDCYVKITNVADNKLNYMLYLLPEYRATSPSYIRSVTEGLAPSDERLKIVQLLFERGISLYELLYYSILYNDTSVFNKLLEIGVNELSEYRRIIVCGLIPRNEQDSYLRAARVEFQKVLKGTTDTRVLRSILNNLVACIPTGKFELYPTDLYSDWDNSFINRYCHDDVFDILVQHTNFVDRVKKWDLIAALIDQNNADGLRYGISEGWLEKKNDAEKLFKYAQSKGAGPEVIGVIMSANHDKADNTNDSKTTVNSDLALDEKPLSTAELKKLWTTQKLDDGSLLIKAYKGDATDVVVPGCIGKQIVSRIDKNAFNPEAERITAIQRESRKNITSIILPDSITEIPESFAKGLEKLERVQLGQKTNSIGKEAFRRCAKLKEIYLPDGITEIKDGVFKGCTELETVIIEGNLRSIGSEAFCYCSSLVSISVPDSVETIGTMAFYECEKLTSFAIPENINIIGNLTFWGCEKLQLSGGSDDMVIRDDVLIYYYGHSEEVSLPNGVKRINSNAFAGNTMLKHIKIPESVTSIGYCAFDYCISLEEVELPDSITSIEEMAFERCEKLKKVRLPQGITDIKYGLFEGCESIEEIYVPDQVTSIGSGVFNGCHNLKKVHIPDGVTVDRDRCFCFCHKDLKIIRY